MHQIANTLFVPDLTMVARATPQPSQKYEESVCCSAWSSLHRRFFRLYPVPVISGLNRWTVWEAKLRRKDGDSRDVSWRVDCVGDDIEQAMREVPGTDPKKVRAATVEEIGKYAGADFKALNACRVSMGAVKPRSIDKIEFEPVAADEAKAIHGEGLFGRSPLPTPTREVLRPRLYWTDESGPHNAILLEWGSSKLVNERGYEDPADLWDALHLGKGGVERYLVVGNLENIRNRYAVIAIIWKQFDGQMSMFGET